MRVVVLALTLVLLAFQAVAGSLQSLERVTISGSEYVRLSEWADTCDFRMKWPRNFRNRPVDQPVRPRPVGH